MRGGRSWRRTARGQCLEFRQEYAFVAESVRQSLVSSAGLWALPIDVVGFVVDDKDGGSIRVVLSWGT